MVWPRTSRVPKSPGPGKGEFFLQQRPALEGSHGSFSYLWGSGHTRGFHPSCQPQGPQGTPSEGGGQETAALDSLILSAPAVECHSDPASKEGLGRPKLGEFCLAWLWQLQQLLRLAHVCGGVTWYGSSSSGHLLCPGDRSPVLGSGAFLKGLYFQAPLCFRKRLY